jgi:hypothetical protein
MELIRVNWQMRKLQVSKHFGGIYMAVSTPGSLALFCRFCPQPGIKLPVNWKELPSWVTHRTATVDANFHADYIRMRRPDLDIMLMDGQEGYMVEEVHFKEYLSVAKEMHQVNLDLCIGFRFSFNFFKPEAILLKPLSC